jgi:hypothetical protein
MGFEQFAVDSRRSPSGLALLMVRMSGGSRIVRIRSGPAEGEISDDDWGRLPVLTIPGAGLSMGPWENKKNGIASPGATFSSSAAFSTSFGFLHGSQGGGVIQDKHLQAKWPQAEIKWYAGTELLHSAPIPVRVAKHLDSDVNATVEIKLFRAGKLLSSLGTIQAKH